MPIKLKLEVEQWYSAPTSDEESKAYQWDHAGCHNVSIALKKAHLLKPCTSRLYELKSDGLRYFLQIRPQGSVQNYLTSRHVSKKTGRKVEKQDLVPFIRDFKFCADLKDSIFDGEFVGGELSSDAQHEMAEGRGIFVYWDLVMLRGVDLRKLPLRRRRRMMGEFEKSLPPWMRWVKSELNAPFKLLPYVIQNKLEGMIEKDLEAPYGSGWVKIKDSDTYDTLLFGYGPTKSADWKRKGWIGALRIGQWQELSQASAGPHVICYHVGEVPVPGMRRMIKGKVHEFLDVGKCSGMTQEMREKVSKAPATYLGQVVEIECHFRLKSGKFRSPRFEGFRDDKGAHECVFVPAQTKTGIKQEDVK